MKCCNRVQNIKSFFFYFRQGFPFKFGSILHSELCSSSAYIGFYKLSSCSDCDKEYTRPFLDHYSYKNKPKHLILFTVVQ
ncbi:hypothetical protein Mapa_004825 [Marchantia paleacea]|nr:hypothetical protein Mapa_004825 [Marchantia paleacea]